MDVASSVKNNDVSAYCAMQDVVLGAYQDREEWTRALIYNTARSGRFLSDRTIREYADDIWKVKHSK